MRIDWRRYLLHRPVLIRTRAEAHLAKMIIAYIGVFSFVTVMRFYTFRTYIDLGIFDQALSSTLHGKSFYETPDTVIIPSGNFLGTHFSPFMYILLPIYALRPEPTTLLVLQTLFLSLGAIPIYRVALHVIHKENPALILAALYLLNPATQSLNMFDFHLEAFLPFFIGMFYYSLLQGNWPRYFLFLGLSVITMEFASIIIGAVCISVIVSGKQSVRSLILHPYSFLRHDMRQLAIPLLTIPVSVATLYGMLLGSSYFAGTEASAQRQVAGFFSSYGDWTVLGTRLVYWTLLFGSLVFLPLLSPKRLIMIIPWMTVTFVSAIPVFGAIGYQHAGGFAMPYMLLATVYSVDKIGYTLFLKRVLVVAIVVCLVMTPLNPLAQQHLAGIAYEDGLPLPSQHDKLVYQALSLIPGNASILTQNNFFTQFTSRSNAYLYRPSNGIRPDYILADASSRWYVQSTFGTPAVCEEVLQGFVNADYGVIYYADGVILMQKGRLGVTPSSDQLHLLYDRCVPQRSCLGLQCHPAVETSERIRTPRQGAA